MKGKKMKHPENLRYTKTHEWARHEGDHVIVGITDYAQHQISDIVHIELPRVGRRVEAGKSCAVVESVKAAFDIYSPVTGVVAQINQDLESNPEIPNHDPYQKGWFFSVKVDTIHEYGQLMDAAAYEKHIHEETH